jgi:hypothetical protein
MITREHIAEALEDAFQDFGDEGGPETFAEAFATGQKTAAAGISSQKRSPMPWKLYRDGSLRGITTLGLARIPIPSLT